MQIDEDGMRIDEDGTERRGDTKNIWPRTRAGWLKTSGFLIVFFLGFALGLLAIDRYRFLDDQGVWVLAAVYVLAFAASFAVARKKFFPSGTPTWARVMARAGWALSFAFLCLGIVGIANGVGSPIHDRTVICVGKRMTRQRDPDHRVYYLQVRPWATTDRVVEISAPRDVYDRVSEGSAVRLAVGDGNLGIEWISAVAVASGSPDQMRQGGSLPR